MALVVGTDTQSPSAMLLTQELEMEKSYEIIQPVPLPGPDCFLQYIQGQCYSFPTFLCIKLVDRNRDREMARQA